jgi:hypothetical protein
MSYPHGKSWETVQIPSFNPLAYMVLRSVATERRKHTCTFCAKEHEKSYELLECDQCNFAWYCGEVCEEADCEEHFKMCAPYSECYGMGDDLEMPPMEEPVQKSDERKAQDEVDFRAALDKAREAADDTRAYKLEFPLSGEDVNTDPEDPQQHLMYVNIENPAEAIAETLTYFMHNATSPVVPLPGNTFYVQVVIYDIPNLCVVTEVKSIQMVTITKKSIVLIKVEEKKTETVVRRGRYFVSFAFSPQRAVVVDDLADYNDV